MSLRVITVGVPVIFGVVFSPGIAESCSCAGQVPSSAAFRSADVVFIGTVEQLVGRQWSTKNADGSISGGVTSGFSTATFSIRRVFRGSVVRSAVIKGEGTDCDESFAVGEVWLVYANQQDGTITTHKCTRTRLVADAGEDMKYLDGRQEGRPQAILFGEVFHQVIGPDGKVGQQALFESLDVIAAGSGERFTVKTDKYGPYQLVLPPGDFEVWAERGGQAVTMRTRVRVGNGDELRLSLSAQFK